MLNTISQEYFEKVPINKKRLNFIFKILILIHFSSQILFNLSQL